MKININLLKSRYDDLETSLVKKLLQFLLPKKIRQKILNNLVEKYLNLSMKDFLPPTGTIMLQNDSDGKGDYIKEWNHPTETRPTDEQLDGVQ